MVCNFLLFVCSSLQVEVPVDTLSHVAVRGDSPEPSEIPDVPKAGKKKRGELSGTVFMCVNQ
jgi:hypothetical protein